MSDKVEGTLKGGPIEEQSTGALQIRAGLLKMAMAEMAEVRKNDPDPERRETAAREYKRNKEKLLAIHAVLRNRLKDVPSPEGIVIELQSGKAGARSYGVG